MPAITQRVNNYLGGVSRQSDDKKLPGQVRECLNGYPDPTFGLTKRPGLKWIANLDTGTTLDNCKWFYIARTKDEKYIGCITPASITVTGNGTGNATNKIGLATATNGSGTGMTVDLTAVDGVVTEMSINTSGTGYASTNTITVDDNAAGTTDNVVGTLTLGSIRIWNVDGTECTVNMDTSTSINAVSYLTGKRLNYGILTVQDNTIITNNLTDVAKLPDPTFNEKRQATLVLSGSPASNVYSVTIEGNTFTHASTATGTYDSILTAIKGEIDALSISGLSVVKHRESLQLTDSNSVINISTSGGQAGDSIYVFQDQVDNLAQLPIQSFHGHIVKIVNTTSVEDTFFAKFVADNGTSGAGHWEEGLDPSVSQGLNSASMPHELLNTALNTFTFRQVAWVSRTKGDDVTNQHPSFEGEKINSAFFYNNRLGFLSKDNVAMSQSKDFFNFYHSSAQVLTDSDPIDLKASTVKPATLRSVLPTTQGLLLFSKDQQFLLSSADKILTPTSTSVRVISSYDMDTEVDPVDMGGLITFISKTPSYTRTFNMQTRGQDENPSILDISRVVAEWVPSTVDTLIASSQNKFLSMSDQDSRYVYFFRTYSDGKKTLIESWFNWQLPGNVQTVVVDSDDFYSITKQGNQFTLSQASLSQSPQDAIIVNNDGSRINPCIDNYAVASSVVNQSVETLTITNGGSGFTSAPTVTIAGTSGVEPGTPGSGATATATITSGAVTALTLTNGGSGFINGAVVTFSGGGGTNAAATASVLNGTKAYLPYTNEADLDPVLIIKGTTATGQFIESGFTINPERGTDGVGTYFKIPKKDFSTIASDVVVGWKYDFNIILPKTYFRTDEKFEVTDFTANLTINRMKFALGLSGICGFKLKTTGVLQGSRSYTGDGSTTIFSWIEEDFRYVDKGQIKVKLDGVVTSAFTVSGDYQITMDSAPANNVKVLIYLDEWYNLNPTITANTYLGNDIALKESAVVSVPIHQRTDNFQLRIFNDSPFPVSLNSMMWEGHYSPRFYKRGF